MLTTLIFLRLLTRLKLHKEGGRYYISSQEDFFHPDVGKILRFSGDLMSYSSCGTISTQDLFAAVVPPLSKLVGLALCTAGFACGLFARIAQAACGVWRPGPRRDN